jgi:hypothetical protein
MDTTTENRLIQKWMAGHQLTKKESSDLDRHIKEMYAPPPEFNKLAPWQQVLAKEFGK